MVVSNTNNIKGISNNSGFAMQSHENQGRYHTGNLYNRLIRGSLNIFDVVIIGAGPAGLTAGIYAKRAGLNVIILQDKYSIGSQICNTYDISNYLGYDSISGQDLYEKFKSHAMTMGVDIVEEKVIEILDITQNIKKIRTKNNIYETRTIVLATGAVAKKAGFINEDKFLGQGISYCATCDGAFYKNKTVAVIGGGDVAIGDAIYLSRIAKKVYLIIRKNYMKASKILQNELLKNENVEIVYNTEVLKVNGNEKITNIIIKDVNSVVSSELDVDGVFVGIGNEPETKLLKDKILMENNYVIAGENCETSLAGIYAIGDIRKKQLRQVITACADGANVIDSVQRFLLLRKY